MKIRNVFLAVIAFAFWLGSVVPANASRAIIMVTTIITRGSFLELIGRDPAFAAGFFFCA